MPVGCWSSTNFVVTPKLQPQRTSPIGRAPGILGIPTLALTLHPVDLTPFRLDPLSHPINTINISKSWESLGPPHKSPRFQ